MTPAPQEQAEARASLIHIDAAKMRGSAEALFDALGLDKTLAEIELLRTHIVERAHRRGKGEGWSR